MFRNCKPRSHWLFTCHSNWKETMFQFSSGWGSIMTSYFPSLCFLLFVFSDNKSQLFFRLDSKSSDGKCCYVRLKTFRSCDIEISRTFSLLLYLSVNPWGVGVPLWVSLYLLRECGRSVELWLALLSPFLVLYVLSHTIMTRIQILP